MKTFWKSLVVVAILFLIAGCPSEGGGGGGSNETPVGAVTVKCDGATLTEANGLTINVGETVTVQASADGATSYALTFSGNVISRTGMAITGLTEGTVVVTCTATNDSGGANRTTFSVKVRPKLTGFKIMWGGYEMDYEEDNPLYLLSGMDLHIVAEPTGVKNDSTSDFTWTADPSTGIDFVPYTEGGVVGKSLEANDPGAKFTIKVTPNQAGLSAGEKSAMEKTFSIETFAGEMPKVTSISIFDSEGAPVTNNSSIDLKRGRKMSLRAELDVSAGANIEWE
ncbi:MAG: hypothetical protein LBG91_05065, partial [Treponema sp.]|nr:hypothetical protein [Treponema sp.]